MRNLLSVAMLLSTFSISANGETYVWPLEIKQEGKLSNHPLKVFNIPLKVISGDEVFKNRGITLRNFYLQDLGPARGPFAAEGGKELMLTASFVEMVSRSEFTTEGERKYKVRMDRNWITDFKATERVRNTIFGIREKNGKNISSCLGQGGIVSANLIVKYKLPKGETFKTLKGAQAYRVLIQDALIQDIKDWSCRNPKGDLNDDFIEEALPQTKVKRT